MGLSLSGCHVMPDNLTICNIYYYTATDLIRRSRCDDDDGKKCQWQYFCFPFPFFPHTHTHTQAQTFLLFYALCEYAFDACYYHKMDMKSTMANGLYWTIKMLRQCWYSKKAKKLWNTIKHVRIGEENFVGLNYRNPLSIFPKINIHWLWPVYVGLKPEQKVTHPNWYTHISEKQIIEKVTSVRLKQCKRMLCLNRVKLLVLFCVEQHVRTNCLSINI